MEQTTTKTQPGERPGIVIDLSRLSEAEKAELLAQLKSEDQTNRQDRRNAYEGLRAEFMHKVHDMLLDVTAEVKTFKRWLAKESEAFVQVMQDYGQTKYGSQQQNYTITDGDFRLHVASNRVKGFDERADLAADRLIKYLKQYMEHTDKGQDDPMYQLAMTLLERNQQGDLDYKSISKLYELEDKFGDAEYSDIMQLFKESNVVQKTAVNYYFWRRDPKTGVWVRIEPSFCRI